MSDDEVVLKVGVVCGICEGSIYMERCTDSTGSGHEWATGSECQRCGTRSTFACPECTGSRA